MIRAILFDFDGVIAETSPYHIAAWQKVFGEFGVEIDANLARQNEGAPAWKICKSLAENAGVHLSESKLKEVAGQKNELFRQNKQTRVYEGAQEILKLSKAHRLKVALVTGTAMANLQSIIPKSLQSEFDLIIKDGDTERGKPYPDPYLKAAHDLNVDPCECLVLENAPLGISAAKSAGAYCIALMTTLPRHQLAAADMVVQDHAEVIRKFSRLIKFG